jgi:hypothetical protein
MKRRFQRDSAMLGLYARLPKPCAMVKVVRGQRLKNSERPTHVEKENPGVSCHALNDCLQ